MLWRSCTVWWRVLSVVAAPLPVSTPPAGLLEWGCSRWPLSSARAWEPHTSSCATAAFTGECVGTYPVCVFQHCTVRLQFNYMFLLIVFFLFWQLPCSFPFSFISLALTLFSPLPFPPQFLPGCVHRLLSSVYLSISWEPCTPHCGDFLLIHISLH